MAKKPQSKSERMAGVVSRSAEKPATNGKPEDQKAAPATATSPAKPEDQKGTPKAKKKISETVTNWKAKDLPAETAKIKILVPASQNPKRGDALRRYSLYKDGMTVKEYIEAAKNAGIRAGLAQADIRWDMVKGFIEVK